MLKFPDQGDKVTKVTGGRAQFTLTQERVDIGKRRAVVYKKHGSRKRYVKMRGDFIPLANLKI